MALVGKPCPVIDSLQFIKGDRVPIPGENAPVIIEFWASWCGPCRQVFPHLSKIANKYKDKGLRVVGVCMEPDTPETRKFVADQGSNMDYSVAVDPQGQAQQLMVNARQSGIPCAFLVDASGTIVFHGHPADPNFTAAVDKVCGAALAPAPVQEALPLIKATKEELMAKPIRELKQILEDRKIHFEDLHEKPELVDRIIEQCGNVTYYK